MVGSCDWRFGLQVRTPVSKGVGIVVFCFLLVTADPRPDSRNHYYYYESCDASAGRGKY